MQHANMHNVYTRSVHVDWFLIKTFEMALTLNKVLISDSVDVSCRKILEDGGICVDYKPGLSKEDLLTTIKVPAPF